MPANRKLLKITETRPSLDVKFFLDYFENDLGWNVDNVYPGYERHANVIGAVMRFPDNGIAPDWTDWGIEDGHDDHSVEGEECEDICICGPVSQIGSFDEDLVVTWNVKNSEEFPVEIDVDNDLYLMRKAYNEEHGIVETITTVSVDKNWEEVDAS